jgi:hypothetical protein
MKKVKKYWMVVLLGGLLMTTLVGVAGARPNDRPAAAISRRITIPAGHFIAGNDNYDYGNYGHYLYNTSGYAEYTAPVVFPTGQSVVVESVTLYAHDNDSNDNISLTLFRTDPTAGTQAAMAEIFTSGSSTTDPRNFTDSSIANNPVKHGKGVYLKLGIPDGGLTLKAYGVRIQYHHGTT